jgi:hypothetical protein
MAGWLALGNPLRPRLLKIYRDYETLFPRSRSELAGSWIASVAAGGGEEIVYRGFLLWYGAMLAGPLAGLVGSSILFGFAHGYQRRFGIFFATLAGALLGSVYLLSGSLALVMWMHATYNIATFTLGRHLLAQDQAHSPG